MLDWLKKTWVLLLVIVAGLALFGDPAVLAVTLYRLSAVALVLLLVDLLLDRRERWGLFSTLDLDRAISRAHETPAAAAFLVVGVFILVATILVLAVATGHAAPLDQARPHLPQLTRAIDSHWPDMPLRHVPAGQIEQESSWKPHATLSTGRELGRGLVQMTIAYDKSGRERFNIYREAVRMRALSAWDWQHDPYNIKYQLSFLVLQDRSNFAQVRPYFVDDTEACKGALVCYNAGTGRWLSRRANARRLRLPANRWDGGLDLAYSQGETALLYGRPLYQAVNEYPRVIIKRAEKYRGLV